MTRGSWSVSSTVVGGAHRPWTPGHPNPSKASLWSASPPEPEKHRGASGEIHSTLEKRSGGGDEVGRGGGVQM